MCLEDIYVLFGEDDDRNIATDSKSLEGLKLKV